MLYFIAVELALIAAGSLWCYRAKRARRAEIRQRRMIQRLQDAA